MSTGHHRGVYSRIDVGAVLVYTTPGSSDDEGLVEAALSLEEKEEVVS